MKQLFILDANALLHRAWHALPPLTNSTGMVVNAVYGTMMVVTKILEDYKPDAFVACWDTEADTFRHVEFKEYKAQRAEQPDELYAQIPLIQTGLKTLGIDSLELDGYEADDLIGTLATRAQAEGWNVTIVTSDRDALQLVRPGITVLAFKKGVSETTTYDAAQVEAQYGLKPSQFIDYKALRGDPSDNIPGVKGIGEKTATVLLQKFETIGGILKAAHDPESDMKKGVREKLLAAEEEIPQIVRLVTILCDAPIEWNVNEHELPTEHPELVAFLQLHGFKSLLRKLEGGTTASVTESAASKKTPKKDVKEPAAVTSSSVNSFELNLEVPTDVATVTKFLAGRTDKTWLVYLVSGQANSLFANQLEGLFLTTVETPATGLLLTPALLAKAEVKAALSTLFADTDREFVTHDAKRQRTLLLSLGLKLEAWSFDTMLAAYLLAAGERNHDLASIALTFANRQLLPDASGADQVRAIIASFEPLRRALKEQNLDVILARFDLPLVPVLGRMEDHGIKVDKEYLINLATELQGDRAKLERSMYELVGHEFNPGSPSQLAEILFTELKLPTKGIKKGKTGYSTAASELEKLKGQHPLIEKIEEQRELAKLLSTYIEVLPTLVDKHNRIHTTFNQAIAATGRLSSTDPNLQNIPIRTELGRRIRRAFIAEDGFELLSCDYSQIELRIIATLAKDEKMLEAFNQGADIHTATAANIWKISQAEVTADQRRIAKAINFGLIFGQGPQGLSQVAGITFNEAKQFIANYFDVYQGIKRYMVETKALVHELGYVESLFGRRRHMPEINSGLPQLRAQAERMAINMPVQATDADLMKLAMIVIDKELAKVSPRSRLILQVHDELLFEVPVDEVEKVAKFAKSTMESVEKIGVPIVVEAKSGKRWGEMKKLSL